MPTAARPKLLGREEARLWTRPLRELTPETSLGFRCIAFAEQVLRVRLDPWQKWFLIHALELNPDGSFRFRTVLLLVARQNGKTTVVKVLTLWALWTGRVRLAVGTAQDLDIARRCWSETIDMALAAPDVEAEIYGRPRRANGQEELRFRNGSAYIIKATTRDAGRGVPGVGLLIADELRTHRDYEAWGALSKTTMAVPNALIVGMSNAGDDESRVLNDLRANALSGKNDTIGIFEWSAADGCELDDPEGNAQANPSLGHGRLSWEALAAARGTDPVAVYRTECLCQRVDTIDGAFDLAAWKTGADPSVTIGPGLDETDEDFAARRGRMQIVACFDVAPDSAHATLMLAAVGPDGRVRVEVAKAWRDTDAAWNELPDLLRRIRPKVVAWFPAGPAAAMATVLTDKRTLPGRGTRFEELKGGTVSAACMGLADLIRARRVLQPEDALLDSQIASAAKLYVADGWRLTRKGAAHVDAVYATAGAVHVALSLPASRGEAWDGVVI